MACQVLLTNNHQFFIWTWNIANMHLWFQMNSSEISQLEMYKYTMVQNIFATIIWQYSAVMLTLIIVNEI